VYNPTELHCATSDDDNITASIPGSVESSSREQRKSQGLEGKAFDFRTFIEDQRKHHDQKSKRDMSQIDNRLPYRVGSAILPALHPGELRVRNRAQKFPNEDQHFEHIRKILDEHGVINPSMGLFNRGRENAEYNEKNDTLAISAKYLEGSSQNWTDAMVTIRDYLTAAGINLVVEILDHTNLRDGPIFPLLTDEFGWNSVLLPKVINIVQDREWLSIDMVYKEDISSRKKERNVFRPTIVICARDADHPDWWNVIMPKLDEALKEQQSQINVQLRYLRHLTLSAGRTVPAPNETYSQVLSMGLSCGTEDRTGTLGGKIVLEKDDKLMTMGITNHHVIFNGPHDKDQYMTEGVRVYCPSVKDHVQRCKDENDSIDQSLQNQQLLALQRQSLSAINSFDIGLGRVYASNLGITQNNVYPPELSSDWALDWCLIGLNEGRDINSAVRIHSSTNVVLPGTTNTLVVDSYCSINHRKSYRVFMKGRTSGFKLGYVSAVESAMNAFPKLEAGSSIVKDKVTTFGAVRCHALFAGDGLREEFTQPGDSGSLVLLDPENFSLPQDPDDLKGFRYDNSFGESNDWVGSAILCPASVSDEDPVVLGSQACIAGLTFASNPGTLVSYMTPMDLVIKDIENSTGGTVKQPTYAGLIG